MTESGPARNVNLFRGFYGRSGYTTAYPADTRPKVSGSWVEWTHRRKEAFELRIQPIVDDCPERPSFA